MTKTNYYLPIINLFEKFISESVKGKRLQKNGELISDSTIHNYKAVLSNLLRFSEKSKTVWLFNTNYKASKINFEKEKRHYKNFYLKFIGFLYSNGGIDNYVGTEIKILRTFFSYLITAKGYEMGFFYKEFYAPKEDIPIIVIDQEQLRFLISDKEFETKLPANLQMVKDIFIVGCTISLRFGDLMALRQLNLEIKNKAIYIIAKSRKTNTSTRIKIPDYVISIIQKYKGKQKTLLPSISMDNFNKKLKTLGKLAGWTNETGKIRSRRGIRKQQKNTDGKLFRFCDLLSSHVMRRTAITTMLMLGMSETMVRKVSGHSANSKEFYKYAKYSDSFMDEQTDDVFKKLMS